MPSHKPSAGFSLIELVMSLFILGLVSGVIMLTLPSRESQEQSEADRLAAGLSAASNYSILSGQVIGAAVSETGYRFFRLVRGQWSHLDSEPLGSRALPPGSVLTISFPSAPETLESVARPNIVFYPMGLNTPFSIIVGEGQGGIQVESRGTGLVESDESNAG